MRPHRLLLTLLWRCGFLNLPSCAGRDKPAVTQGSLLLLGNARHSPGQQSLNPDPCKALGLCKRWAWSTCKVSVLPGGLTQRETPSSHVAPGSSESRHLLPPPHPHPKSLALNERQQGQYVEACSFGPCGTHSATCSKATASDRCSVGCKLGMSDFTP